MPFQVQYDAALDCVVSIVSGDLDTPLVGAFFTEMGRVATQNQCTCMLSDLRKATIVASTVEIYEMVKTLRQRQIKTSFRRAIVITRDTEDYTFWETISHNKGFAGVRVFEDYAEAKAWVLQHDPPRTPGSAASIQQA